MRRAIFAMGMAMAAARAALGAVVAPADLLVSHLSNGVLTEYTPAGGAVQSFTFPDFARGGHDLRGITIDSAGNVYAYNGTFTPQLSTLVPATGQITNQTTAGWSTANGFIEGGIGLFGTGIYVTDELTANDGATKGVVRFSTIGDPATRFGTGNLTPGYLDLTIGGDGLLYALDENINVDVFDPTTFALERTVSFDPVIRDSKVYAIAVSASGNIYAGTSGGKIFAASSAGHLINSLSTGTADLADINLNDAGQIVAGTTTGRVILTDTTLANQTSFATSPASTVHVAFATPLTVPEPTCAWALISLATCLRRRRMSRVR